MESIFAEVTYKNDTLTLTLKNSWTIHSLSDIQKSVSLPTKKAKNIIINGKALEEIDTSGAWHLISLLKQLQTRQSQFKNEGFSPTHAKIIDIVRGITLHSPALTASAGGMTGFFIYLGKIAAQINHGMIGLIRFFGEFCIAFATTLLQPTRLRLRSMVYHINEIGVKAVPIISLMAFLISIVLGYQGAHQLKQFGATIFTVDLVAISVLREMGVLITAIMVAGRSGSAFAAQIGVMQVNEEVDALRTIGLDPFDMLVLPRVFAILIALPILTFIADIVGLLGTLFVSSVLLDLSYLQFIERVREAVSMSTFWIGLVKAPVFAVLIGMVGCRQGMSVRNSAAEVGARTTMAVVQSIFFVILADALFSVLFTMLGI